MSAQCAFTLFCLCYSTWALRCLCWQVFLNMLVKVTRLDLPLWHQILVLEILRVSSLGTTEIDACGWPILTCVHPLIHQGFCIEARTLRSLFQTFDMYVLYPHSTIISMPLSLLVVGLIFDLSRSFHIMLVLQDRKLVSACLSQKQCWHYCIYWLIVHILLLVVDFQENWSLNLTSVGM
jgi:hypothetical protein